MGRFLDCFGRSPVGLTVSGFLLFASVAGCGPSQKTEAERAENRVICGATASKVAEPFIFWLWVDPIKGRPGPPTAVERAKMLYHPTEESKQWYHFNQTELKMTDQEWGVMRDMESYAHIIDGMKEEDARRAIHEIALGLCLDRR